MNERLRGGTACAGAQTDRTMSAPRIHQSLDHWHRSTGAVGVVAAVVDRERVRWDCGLGVADLDTRRPMDPASTILNVASVSKLVTATALMTLVEAGSIGLDDPVDGPLGSTLRHPGHPEQPITVRQLLTHTSPSRTARPTTRDMPAATPTATSGRG